MKFHEVNKPFKFQWAGGEIERLIPIEDDCRNKCQNCVFGKVTGRHCFTGRIEDWGCRFPELSDTMCGIEPSPRADGLSVVYKRIVKN